MSDPAAITKQLLTIVDVQRFLTEWRDDRFLLLGQFCLDWIEEALDRIVEILESEGITTDDETFCGAIHYRADCLLEVLRKDADCHEFFFQLAKRTRQKPTEAETNEWY